MPEIPAAQDSNQSEQQTQPQQKETTPTIIPNAPLEPETQNANPNITDKTLSTLDQIMQNPKEIKNPLELANILFNCGRLKEAAVCYQQALDVNDSNNVMYKDKAWILFQAGNCLQKSDPQTANKMYRKLVTDYPESFWSDAAIAKNHLVEWYIQQKPNTLLMRR
jgi:tetratricopeptide (TPR) repeat protein